MSLTDKARKILTSLESKPDLFAEVARLMKDEYEFASAWQHDGTGWYRTNLGGSEYAAQAMPAVGGGFDWTTSADGGNEPSEIKAKAAADKVLRAEGITLPIFDTP